METTNKGNNKMNKKEIRFLKTLAQIKFYLDCQFQSKDELIPIRIVEIYEIIETAKNQITNTKETK